MTLKKTTLLKLIDDIYAAEKLGLVRNVRHLPAGLNSQYIRFATYRPMTAETTQKLTTYLQTECDAVRDATISKYDVVILYTPSQP